MEHAFNPKRLTNWEVPAVDKNEVSARIASDSELYADPFLKSLSDKTFTASCRLSRLTLDSAHFSPVLARQSSLWTARATCCPVSANAL